MFNDLFRILFTPSAEAGGAATIEQPPTRGAEYDEAFAAIDKIDGDVLPGQPETPVEPKAEVKPPAEPAKPAEAPKAAEPAKASKPDMLNDLSGLKQKEAELKAAKPAEAAKPKDETPSSMKQFREQYEMTKKERDDLAAKVKELERAKEEGTKREIEAATAALKKEMDDIRKRNEELDTEVRFMDYTRSRDYREKFEEPIKEAWKKALDDIDGITVTDEDGEERKASHHDIVALMSMPTGKAAVEAQRMFGPAAPEIMVHRRKLIELRDSRNKAIEDWKQKGIQRQQDRETQQQAQLQSLHSAFDEEFKNTETEYAALFGNEEGDDEGNGLLESGMKLVRMATRGEGLDPNLSPTERAELMARAQAQIGLRARAFGRERLRTLRLQQKVKELEQKLKDAAGSEPGAGRVEAQKAAALVNPEDAIDAL